MDKLETKIDRVWNSKSRCVQKRLFTPEEISYMGGDIHKFIWDYYNNPYVCDCGQLTDFISIKNGYKPFCKQCIQIKRVKKTQDTMMNLYGVVSVFQLPEVHNQAIEKASSKESRSKAQATMYSNGTHQSGEYHISKSKSTKLERYDNETFNNIEKAQSTKIERYNNKHYNNREKAQSTMVDKFGFTSYAKTSAFRECHKGNNNGSRSHFKNIKDFNDDFIISSFVSSEGFDLYAACEYFQCTYNTFKDKDYYKNNIKRIGRTVEDNFKSLYKSLFAYNTRKLIPPYEVDMFSEDYNFGIEYDGLYWHSQIYKNKDYHLMKTERCETIGIQLFHIFENEWMDLTKRSIWKSIINGKMYKHDRIFARKCVIREIDNITSKEFLETHHLQGNVNASLKIGLYYKDELVSLMTFGLSRYTDCEYELYRFATMKNTTVVGAGSKLLSYFEHKYKPKSLVSYANRRFSQGNFYDKVGFSFSHNTAPNHFYFKNDLVLESRIKFQKHKLKDKLKDFNENISGKDNMINNGYNIIYDCGNKVYIKYYRNK